MRLELKRRLRLAGCAVFPWFVSCAEQKDVFYLDTRSGEVIFEDVTLSVEEQIAMMENPAYEDAIVKILSDGETQTLSGAEFKELIRETADEIWKEALEAEGASPSDPVRDESRDESVPDPFSGGDEAVKPFTSE